jgi:hypothetical protein
MPTRFSDGAPRGADLGTHAVGRGGNHVTRGCGVQGCFSPKGKTMKLPTFDVSIIENTGITYFSFEISKEGIFLFLTPMQFALLWPGVDA